MHTPSVLSPPGRSCAARYLCLMSAALLGGSPFFAHAEGVTNITSDGTLGTTITQGGNVYDIGGGTIKGSNQFHSFGQFSVGTGDVAAFNGPAGIVNILSRVTGGNVSEINGTLQSNISGANLYLMNPSGILFGPNAQLDVSGSVHATTADYIGLADGTRFVATAVDDAAVLTTAAPAAFGFLNSNAASIDVQTGVFDFDTFIQTGDQGAGYTSVLQVPEGETLSFVGGTVNVGSGVLADGFVHAPAGRVNLVSTNSPGEAVINSDGSIGVDGFAQLGETNIKGNSFVDARDVYIRSGQLTIEDATVFPGLLSLLGQPSPPPDGGSVDIEASGDVTITATGGPVLNLPGIQTFAGSPGDVVPGDVPDIHIVADSLSLAGPQASIQAARLGPGNPPDITINANAVTLQDGASIALLNFFEGPGGTVTIDTDTLALTNDAESPVFTGIASQSFFHPGYGFVFFPFLANGDSGPITINANESLTMRGETEITSDSFAFGNSGKITLTTSNAVLNGPGSISSQSGLAGNSADIDVTASEYIQIQDGFRITAATGGSGNAGTVTINAGESIDLSGTDARITSLTRQPSDDDPALTAFAQLFDGAFQANLGTPIPDYPALREALGVTPRNGDLMDVLSALNALGLTAVADLTPGDAGTVTLNSPELSLTADSRIETSTGWDGNAGAIVANTGTLSLNDGGAIRSRSGIELPDGTLVAGTGNGGQIDVTATDSIGISGRSPTSGDGSSISTSTFGDGNGGDISLSAGNTVVISNGGVMSADSLGQAGNGSGLAGDITISANNEIELSENGTISTRAVTADGGNIVITANEQVYLLKSDITTSVESGFGGGGNIDIDPKFVILNQSNILANAFGGPGGNINIVAGNFIVTPDSVIDASSALGLDGTVNISSPDEEVADDLAVLPDNYLDVTSLMSERCGTTAGASSLVDAGPGGLAVDPDGYLPSFATATNQEDETKGANQASLSGKRWWTLHADPALQLAQVTCTQ